MAIRLEKSGGLILIRGGEDPPEKVKRTGKGLWLVFAVCVAGILYASPLASGWPAVAHAMKSFLAVVW
jgi:hypothetical protein